jgi:hypothetical protein
VSIPFRYARGATISLSGNVLSGDPTGWVGTAFLRTTVKGQTELVGNEPIAAEFDVAFIAAAPPAPARYALTITAAEAATIEGEYFLADIKLVSGANVAYSALVAIRIYNPATAPVTP